MTSIVEYVMRENFCDIKRLARLVVKWRIIALVMTVLFFAMLCLTLVVLCG